MVSGVTPLQLVRNICETFEDLSSISGLEAEVAIVRRTNQGCSGETIRLEFAACWQETRIETRLDSVPHSCAMTK